MSEPARTKWAVRRQTALLAAAAAAFAFLTGWAAYRSFKRELCEFVMRQVRATQYEDRGYNWALRRCGRPIERELAGGGISPGDSLADVAARHPPERTETYGRYTYLLYFPPLAFGGGPVVIARDGVVVAAVTSDCCFAHVFFQTMTPAELRELGDLRRAAEAAREAAERATRMAVAGGGATIDPWTLPRPDPVPEN